MMGLITHGHLRHEKSRHHLQRDAVGGVWVLATPFNSKLEQAWTFHIQTPGRKIICVFWLIFHKKNLMSLTGFFLLFFISFLVWECKWSANWEWQLSLLPLLSMLDSMPPAAAQILGGELLLPVPPSTALPSPAAISQLNISGMHPAALEKGPQQQQQHSTSGRTPTGMVGGDTVACRQLGRDKPRALGGPD